MTIKFTSRIDDPNLRLERPLRNRHEPDQIHIIQAHAPFPDFPSLIGGFFHRISLGSSDEQQRPGIFADETYSHRLKIVVEFLGNLVCEFTASYPGAIPRPA